MTEIFKPLKDIVENGDGYFVSNIGNVKSIKNGKEKILKPVKDKDGYLTVFLSKNSKVKVYKIHRLVALVFIPNPNKLPQVNHKKSKEKDNNCVDNLEWCDATYNNQYSKTFSKATKARTKETFEKISYSKGRKIICIDVKNNEIKYKFSGINKIVDKMNLTKYLIYKSLNEGKIVNGYLFKEVTLEEFEKLETRVDVV